jgi:hypothetical protein
MRTWHSVSNGGIVFEDQQTGDGRVWAQGAWSWEDPADIPVQWNPNDNASHDGTLTVGALTSVTRTDNRIEATGTLDDESDAGAEIVRLMGLDPPLASGVSVVYDNVAVQIIDTTGGVDPVEVMASATVMLDHRGTHVLNAPPHIAALLAAAGDPVPSDGEVVWEEAADSIVYNYTASRLRALTLVDIPAFVDARVELDGATAAPAAEPVVAAARTFPVAPPRAWLFEPEPPDDSPLWVQQQDGSWAVPLTILDSGQFFGHACYQGQCHIGYLGDCVSPPVSSNEFLSRLREVDEHGATVRPGYLTGVVRCDDGTDVPIAPVVLSADHPDGWLFHADAQDEYANTGLAWGDARVVQSPVGVWVSGALRPEVTAEQLRVLRASAFSGDWREVPGEAGAQFVAVLTVSRPGFPIARAALAASGLVVPAPRAYVRYDEAGALVAAGGLNVVRHTCADCEARAKGDGEVLALLRTLEVRTRHMRPAAAAAALARLHA